MYTIILYVVLKFHTGTGCADRWKSARRYAGKLSVWATRCCLCAFKQF